jgi:hypothetical protein
MSGRQIEITRAPRGQYVLRCPTTGCASTVKDWIYTPGAREEKEKPKRSVEFPFFLPEDYPKVEYG